MNNNFIEINRLGNTQHCRVLPMSLKRSWMNEDTAKFSYNCLPLNIANTYGWNVLSPSDFSAEWDGGNTNESVQITQDSGYKIASSDFGNGILTIGVDFIIRTSENTSIYLRGIPNHTKTGLIPLDAVVETDWLPFTFTYNFKFTEPCQVFFKKNEPLFSFFPIQRSFIESFRLKEGNIEDDLEFFEEYQKYNSARVNAEGAQRFYMQGRGPEKKYNIVNHTKRIGLDN